MKPLMIALLAMLTASPALADNEAVVPAALPAINPTLVDGDAFSFRDDSGSDAEITMLFGDADSQGKLPAADEELEQRIEK